VPLDVLHHIAAQRRDGARNPRDLDVLHARLATAQEGVVGRDRLLALDCGRGVIARRIERGLLIRKHRGVYAVGHDAISDRGRAIAALLAVGHGTALSLEASAAHWELPLSMPPYIDVVHPTRRPRNREGIRVHRRTAEITRHNGLLVTTIEQTLRDLDDERLTAEAQVMGLIPRGTHGVEPTRSEVVRRFVRLVREAGLPQPLVNATIPSLRDRLPLARRARCRRDRWLDVPRRQKRVRTRSTKGRRSPGAGLRGDRVTWRAVTRDEMGVVARLAAVLAMRTPHRAPTHPPAGG
jgi:hypothetical protein